MPCTCRKCEGHLVLSFTCHTYKFSSRDNDTVREPQIEGEQRKHREIKSLTSQRELSHCAIESEHELASGTSLLFALCCLLPSGIL